MVANKINAVGFSFRVKEIFLIFAVHIETNWYLADF